MTQGITGLLCAACNGEITSGGTACTACRATHHPECFEKTGACASCLSGKRPAAFGAGAPVADDAVRAGWRPVPLILALSVGMIIGRASAPMARHGDAVPREGQAIQRPSGGSLGPAMALIAPVPVRPEPATTDAAQRTQEACGRPPPDSVARRMTLQPPRSRQDVVDREVPLGRSDVGARALPAHPLCFMVPGGRTATTVAACVHPSSETAFTWGYCAVYACWNGEPAEYLGTLSASGIRTGDHEQELTCTHPFTYVLLYPLDWSGHFAQSSLVLDWIAFRGLADPAVIVPAPAPVGDLGQLPATPAGDSTAPNPRFIWMHTGIPESEISWSNDVAERLYGTLGQITGLAARRFPIHVQIRRSRGGSIGAWTAAGELGFEASPWQPSKTCQLFLAHALTNLLTGEGVSGGWPHDWWAGDQSPFPLVAASEALARLGHTDWSQEILGEHAGDPFTGMFLEWARRDKFGLFRRAFAMMREDGIQWDRIAGNPSALRSEYVLAYLSLGAGENLTPSFQRWLGSGRLAYSVDPATVESIMRARQAIDAARRRGDQPRVARSLGPFLAGDYELACKQ